VTTETGERHGAFRYSPERRTALVLCGTGAHGAYHAGVLRALQEAGVKIDVMAGQGVGAASAALAAIDGAARLWDAGGVWRNPRAAALYVWKGPLRLMAAAVGVSIAVLLATVAWVGFAAIPLPAFIAQTVLTVVALALVASVIAVVAEEWRAPARRRADGRWWWRLLGAPLETRAAIDLFTEAIGRPLTGRRYAEVLADSLGQPGFRELMLVATDLDSRRDLVAALVREPYRRDFVAPRPNRDRRAELIDLAGGGREHALDVVAAALTPPLGCDPHLVTFAPDSYWRGETHRLCDRPGAISRLLEELAIAGVSQVIIVSAVASAAAPHRLRAARLDARQRLGEFLAAAESASLRDAVEMARLRFDSIYLICPAHNPIGAFDLGGAYDEASDRRQDLGELMDRAYEDAYRQFIEPVVGASGEHLARAESEPSPLA